MARRIEISSELIVEAMQSSGTRAGLKKVADRVQGRAAALAASEAPDSSPPRVVEGTRPKGRPYARVQMDDGAAQEWGTSKTQRRRILGRAAEGA